MAAKIPPFSKFYPFEYTTEFQRAFGAEPFSQLPASYRVTFWKQHIGKPTDEKRRAEVARENLKATEAHCKQVAKIKSTNAQRKKANDLLRATYQAELKKFQEDCVQYRKQARVTIANAREQVRKQCVADLECALTKQSKVIDDALHDASDVAFATWKGESRWKLTAFAIFGHFFMPSILLPILFCVPSYLAARAERQSYFEHLLRVINSYGAADGVRAREGFCFWTVARKAVAADVSHIHSPTQWDDGQGTPNESYLEQHPLGVHDFDAYESLFSSPWTTLFWALASLIPVVGVFVVFLALPSESDLRQLIAHIDPKPIKESRRKKLLALLQASLSKRATLNKKVRAYLKDTNALPPRPTPPRKPHYQSLISLPSPPYPKQVFESRPPDECFDTVEKGNFEYAFKGAQIYDRQHVSTLANARLFEDNSVRPYFWFGGVRHSLNVGSPNILVTGQTGSGKTTTILQLMSSLLPLSKAQAKRIASDERKYPLSPTEWSRSQSFQAVVYNAKGKYLKYLQAFGFDQSRDLFSLDPSDPHGFAWDMAKDIDTAESVEKFAEYLIPMNKSAQGDEQVEFWFGTARTVVEAVVNSFRNAARLAGTAPSWTLRDLVTATRTRSSIKHVLQWHDTPEDVIEEVFGLADAQVSSVMMTLRECMKRYTVVANRWWHAQQAGRVISFKRWARDGANTVILLPNTRDNPPTYGQLNLCILKAIADVVLTDKYSRYVDGDGKQCYRRRQFILDELGQSGRISDALHLLMGEGREFGVNVTLGLHQLSQARQAFGEDASETLLGLCSFTAFLKSTDRRTQKWMSEHVGTCLRAYEKKTFSYSVSNGVTTSTSITTAFGETDGTQDSRTDGRSQSRADGVSDAASRSHTTQTGRTTAPGQRPGSSSSLSDTEGDTKTKSRTVTEGANQSETSGSSHQESATLSATVSESRTSTTSEGVSVTRELRGESAIEPHEFSYFPDPETTGKCEGVYRTPSLPVWRTALTKDDVAPVFQFPECLGMTMSRRDKQDDDALTKSSPWTDDDLTRLGIADFVESEDKSHGQLPMFDDEVTRKDVDDSRNDDPDDMPPNSDSDDMPPMLGDFQF